MKQVMPHSQTADQPMSVWERGTELRQSQHKVKSIAKLERTLRTTPQMKDRKQKTHNQMVATTLNKQTAKLVFDFCCQSKTQTSMLSYSD